MNWGLHRLRDLARDYRSSGRDYHLRDVSIAYLGNFAQSCRLQVVTYSPLAPLAAFPLVFGRMRELCLAWTSWILVSYHELSELSRIFWVIIKFLSYHEWSESSWILWVNKKIFKDWSYSQWNESPQTNQRNPQLSWRAWIVGMISHPSSASL